jgi:glycine/D-amino acid oxidase-like deaminating enzyme
VAPKLLLRNGLVNLFPELENVRLSHSWFGNVAMNRDMLPRIFEKDGVVYATGFCGSGVGLGAVDRYACGPQADG